jgi:hypothetical protein
VTTYIVSNYYYPTKKALKAGVNGNTMFVDPSITPGAQSGTLHEFIRWGYKSWTVTTKDRKWFAEVTVDSHGKVRVK